MFEEVTNFLEINLIGFEPKQFVHNVYFVLIFNLSQNQHKRLALTNKDPKLNGFSDVTWWIMFTFTVQWIKSCASGRIIYDSNYSAEAHHSF